jgi:hypothetical protein
MNIPHAPKVQPHVKLAWWKRNPERSIDVQTAWREGIPIEAPNYSYDNARLHEPSGTVLLARNDVLKTVIYADGIELADDHLTECPRCEQRYEKTPNLNECGCPWCEDLPAEIKAAAYQPLPG